MKLEFFIRHRILIIIVSLGLLLGAFAIWLVCDIMENHRIDVESVTWKASRVVEFAQPAKVSDFIDNLNGEYLNDFEIDTTKLGRAEVQFEYRNIKNKKRQAKFDIEVVDTTAPVIYGQSAYSVPVGYTGDLTNLMISGDNADDHPLREITGIYNLEQPGEYVLQYLITDASGNTARHDFTLSVVKPSEESPAVQETIGIPIADVVQKHKTEHTNIGIDVSRWQGDIDWAKVRAAGVEFAFIRVGYQVDFGSEYTLDTKFKSNIEGALQEGLPVGVYFYSCADSIDDALHQAEWVIEQVQDYRLELGIVFDWEEWGDFNRAGMSFYTLEKVAQCFLETVEAAGYEGLLYGSKNYLNRFWQGNTRPVWLAQYYDHPTYEKPFRFWQLADTGIVPGISGYVDLDVWYNNPMHP